ncbi:MAG: histidine triad nucleotide-binding protein [Candidatus Omnitrophica bacterium]|nr:histidine triad nucleotide-binding protein [Candidatus Omnitrophota bacterium]
MENCLFCKIAKKEIPSTLVYEDASILAFKDINPQAPVHTIIIPREHIERVSEITEKNASLLGEMALVGNRLAQKEGVSERGYRFVINCNREGGQTVFHLHLHLLGGRSFRWPPG